MFSWAFRKTVRRNGRHPGTCKAVRAYSGDAPPSVQIEHPSSGKARVKNGKRRGPNSAARGWAKIAQAGNGMPDRGYLGNARWNGTSRKEGNGAGRRGTCLS
ncbi:MAG: hypothetical protein C6W57_09295 [Caldibacillus debilis]|nr:MAG: hypothetical protein C6W57_09295 [Caldibacillus debilis]